MTTLIDALTGAGALGANWTSTGTWSRTGSGARQTDGGAVYYKGAYTGAPMESQNYRVAATIAYDANASRGMGIAGRWASGATVSGYVLIRFANEVYRIELAAGAEVSPTLVSTPGTGSVALAMECENSVIRSYVNTALVDTLTDSSFLTGTPGIVAFGGDAAATNLIINWSARDIMEIAIQSRVRGYQLYIEQLIRRMRRPLILLPRPAWA